MLPGVEGEQRGGALADVAVVVVDLLDDQAPAERLPGEDAPAAALDADGGGGQLLAEGLEGAEVLGDRVAEGAVGAVAALRGEVLPEQRVQDVAGEVEGERLLQADEAAVLLLVARLGELFEGVVGALDVGGVVLGVVQLQDLGGHRALEGGVVVRQVGKRVGAHGGTRPLSTDGGDRAGATLLPMTCKSESFASAC
ncbi:hypothetical protein GCM10009663_45750 [Kitasatospora arboriphila]|uniref:Uncharacterized protein n=1 Tax=Kitasatospora arboriphila TaxID=258052 RepID=A0ABN1TQM0_9ACTN